MLTRYITTTSVVIIHKIDLKDDLLIPIKQEYMSDQIKFTCAISNLSARQDSVVVFTNGGCLADGHGTDGGFYSSQTCDEIEKRHLSKDKNVEKWSEEIHNNLLSLRQEIESFLEIKDGVPYRNGRITHGGTTATYVSVDPSSKTMTIANAGDSDGYVLTQNGDVFQAHRITANHKPSSKEQYLRLEALRQSGMNVGRMVWNTKIVPHVPIFDESGNAIDYFSPHTDLIDTTKAYNNVSSALELDPTNEEKKEEKKKCLEAYHQAYRKSSAHPTFKTHSRLLVGTAKGEYGCYLEGPKDTECGRETYLACTVSIGDHHAKKVGSRSNWDVSRIDLTSFVGEKRMIFVASDGVHDCFTEEDLAKIVLTTPSDQELLQKFVDKSKELFGSRKPGTSELVQADDISFFRADISHL